MAGRPDAFDAVLVGAGQANNPLSRSLAGAGKRVALIEKGKIGGTCVNTGCTPTKTMLEEGRGAARLWPDEGRVEGKVRVSRRGVDERTSGRRHGSCRLIRR